MIKISDLKKVKKTCFDKIARSATNKDGLAVSMRPIGLDYIEVLMSNGEDYGRIVLDNYSKAAISEVCLCWHDFVKICELFKSEISIQKEENRIRVWEDKTSLNCVKFAHTYNTACNFKFDFSKALLIETKDLFILDSHLPMLGYAIINDKLISCDGCICIINNLCENFGEKYIQYPDKFPDGDWYIDLTSRVIVSKDKRMSLTKSQLTGTYPSSLLELSRQPMNNSFTCNAKELFDKIQQCSLIFTEMDLNFGKDELIIESVGKGDNKFKTYVPVKYKIPPTKKALKFSIKYLSDFCKCADSDGNVTVLFDDMPGMHMLRAESDKYTIFAMGIVKVGGGAS